MNATPSVLTKSADEALHGTEIPRGGNDGICPEQSLFRSVIVMAWHDAWIHSDWVLCNGKARGAEERAERGNRARATARRWLTITWGRCQEDRELICDMAGIDESVVRKLAIAKWAQIKAQEQQLKESSVDHKTLAARARVDLDRAFQQLLQRTSELTDSDVDAMLGDLAETESKYMLATTA